jgi:predicted DNA-binding transcriptional regulator AlpA
MRIYTLNEEFFSTWTPEMAYMLGFIAADGCLHKYVDRANSYGLSMNLHSKDRHILESFNNMIGSNRPIGIVPATTSLAKNGKTYNKAELSVWRINSFKIAQDLMRLHIHPRKSWTAEWPTDYPSEFMSHYVRGFFDGDGCIHLIKHPSQKSKYIGVNFCGPEQYLLGLKATLEPIIGKPYGYMRPVKVKGGTYFQLVYSGAATIKKLMDWMYEDSAPEMRLLRKYRIYKDFYRNIDDATLRQNDLTVPHWKDVEKWLVEIFDEEKSISDWASDERCQVSRQTLYHRIIKCQMNPKDAMLIPAGDVESVNHRADVPSNRATLSWANVKEIRQLKKVANLSNAQIAKDLDVSIHIVADVLMGRTWQDDTYVPVKSSQGRVQHYQYNGEQMTLTQISALCGVSKPTLDRRLKDGMSMSEATKNGRKESKEYNLPEVSRTGLTAGKVKEIRQDYLDGVKGIAAYEKHDLKKSHYMDIILNRTWKEDNIWWKD